MSLTLLLIITAISVTAILIFMIHQIDEKASYVKEKKGRAVILIKLILILILGVFINSSISYGQRPLSWFVMQSILMYVTIVLLTWRVNSLDTFILPLIIVALTSIAIISAQGTPIVHSDHWRDFAAAQLIIIDGNFWQASALMPTYNMPAPITEILVAVLSVLINVSLYHAYTILSILFPFLGTLILYICIWKIFEKDRLALVASALFILSNPMLAFWSISHQGFASLLSLTLFSLLLKKERILITREKLYTFLILIAVIIMVHVSLVIAIISLLVSMIFLAVVKAMNGQGKKSDIYMFFKLLTLVVVITYTYWILTLIFEFILKFYVFRLMNQIQSPVASFRLPALQTENEYITLSYSIQVAFAASYVYWYLLKTLKKSKRNSYEDLSAYLAIIGGAILLFAFLSFYKFGAWSDTRYLGVSAYICLLIPAIICFISLIRKGNMWVKILTILIALMMLSSGSLSVNWAPDQYRTTTTRFPDAYGQTISSMIVKLIPDRSTVSAVRGINDPLYYLALLDGKSYKHVPEFYHMLYNIKKGSKIEPEDIVRFIKPGELLVLDKETFYPLLYYRSENDVKVNALYVSTQYYIVSG